jgi:formate dehydrogenase major subunit
MGSNMAEQHPVGFQWVIEAKERGATVIHVDPRFTRTSAMADLHVPIRAGTDVAFLGGIVRYIFEHDAWFEDYVRHYTNGPVVIERDFQDTEDAGGFFSGWNPDHSAYVIDSWGYSRSPGEATAGKHEQQADVSGEQAHGAHGMKLQGGQPPDMDQTMLDERCVLQLVRRHFARYTPELVADTCGCSADDFTAVARAMCENSGRERTSSVVYSVGWTQHTIGVQNIRAASIIQLLLGNVGRPGGGVLALRGHANIQGSTDIPTLYNILPGYIPVPHPQSHPTLDTFVELNGPDTGAWGNLRSYMVSLLKAWWGEAACEANDFCFHYLPRINGDHSHYAMMLKMLDGGVKGMFCVGQNPAVGSANSSLMRAALAKLDWLVVRDFQPTESAMFWKDSPEHESGDVRTEDIHTEVFFLPAAAHTEKDGNFTNTQRLLQWHHKACEPPGDCRSELHWIYHLGRAIRGKLADSMEPRDRPIRDLTWDYPVRGPHDEPDAEHVLQEISGRNADGSFLSSYDELESDGSTTCGSWIHAGSTRTASTRQRARSPGTSRTGWRASGGGRGRRTPAFSITARPRIPRASRGPSASAMSGGMPSRSSGRASPTRLTSSRRSRRTSSRSATPRRWTQSPATSHSSCTRMGAAGCSLRPAWSTGRCPPTTSRTSHRSPTRSTPSNTTQRGRCSIGPGTRITPRTASPRRTCSRSC